MEKRAVLAIVLSSIVVMVWMQFVMPKPLPRKTAEKKEESEKPKDDGKIKPDPDPKPDPKPEPDPKPSVREDVSELQTVVELDKLKLVFTNKGASLRKGILKEHKAEAGSEENLEYLNSYLDPDGNSLDLEILDFGTGEFVEDLSAIHFNVEPAVETLDLSRNKELRYSTLLVNKLEVVKTFVFDPAKQIVEVKLEFHNSDPEKTLELAFQQYSARGIEYNPHGMSHFETILCLESKKRKQFNFSHFKGTHKKGIDVELYQEEKSLWAGVKDRYFCAILRPDEDSRKNLTSVGSRAVLKPDSALPGQKMVTNLASFYQSDKVALKPGETSAAKFEFFLGARKDGGKYGFYNLLSYGDYVAPLFSPLLVTLLKGFHFVVRNYGVAIILLTILVKMLLHPLSRKAFNSMRKLTEVQPKMKALQERYKNNRKKLNEEIFKLYREEGVNPMGGCFPILIQLPVWIGLYSALDRTVELQHSSFLWAVDLSAPDHVYTLPFGFLWWGGGVNPLPIIMSIVMWLQIRSMPKSPDPQMQQQQAIQQVMPFVMMVIFYAFPSGLALYFLCSSLFSMAEQKYLKTVYERGKSGAAGVKASAENSREQRMERDGSPS